MINDHLSSSQKCVDLLQQIETLRLNPYDDQTGRPITAWCKGATIGFGHLIPEHEWPKFRYGLPSLFEAEGLLEVDLEPLEEDVRRVINVPLNQQQFDALVLLAFNIGAPQFRQSSVVRLINDPRAVTPYVSLGTAWKAWNKSQGKINAGLINRRDCEWQVWMLGIYEHW